MSNKKKLTLTDSDKTKIAAAISAGVTVGVFVLITNSRARFASNIYEKGTRQDIGKYVSQLNSITSGRNKIYL